MSELLRDELKRVYISTTEREQTWTDGWHKYGGHPGHSIDCVLCYPPPRVRSRRERLRNYWWHMRNVVGFWIAGHDPRDEETD